MTTGPHAVGAPCRTPWYATLMGVLCSLIAIGILALILVKVAGGNDDIAVSSGAAPATATNGADAVVGQVISLEGFQFTVTTVSQSAGTIDVKVFVANMGEEPRVFDPAEVTLVTGDGQGLGATSESKEYDWFGTIVPKAAHSATLRYELKDGQIPAYVLYRPRFHADGLTVDVTSTAAE